MFSFTWCNNQATNYKIIKPTIMESLINANNHNFNGDFPASFGANKPAFFPNALARPGKQSFLVFKHNKYLTVSTGNVAFFYIKYDCSLLVCFDKQEYNVNYSLEQLQQLLPELQFYRLNRQYLINFNAVKEVEHYFARKLLVKLGVSVAEKLLVSKEKAPDFLRWLENR
jgi:DNA-binding LytR/AlgR family response regulator